jgi:alpha-beta hydrolase superfamily lysophospholipase
MDVPCLLMHGKGDKITDWKGSVQFAKRQPAVTLKLWEDLYHELHNETCREEIFAAIKQYITEQLWNGELKSPTQKV